MLQWPQPLPPVLQPPPSPVTTARPRHSSCVVGSALRGGESLPPLRFSSNRLCCSRRRRGGGEARLPLLETAGYCPLTPRQPARADGGRMRAPARHRPATLHAHAPTRSAARTPNTQRSGGGGSPCWGAHTLCVPLLCVPTRCVCMRLLGDLEVWAPVQTGDDRHRRACPRERERGGGGGIWAPTRRETVGMRKVCVWRRLASTGLPPRLPPRKDKEDRRGSRCYN